MKSDCFLWLDEGGKQVKHNNSPDTPHTRMPAMWTCMVTATEDAMSNNGWNPCARSLSSPDWSKKEDLYIPSLASSNKEKVVYES